MIWPPHDVTDTIQFFIHEFTHLFNLSFVHFLATLVNKGAIPDNERVNRPKRGKLTVENREEIDAFEQIKGMLVTQLDAGNNNGTRNPYNSYILLYIHCFLRVTLTLSLFTLYHNQP